MNPAHAHPDHLFHVPRTAGRPILTVCAYCLHPLDNVATPSSPAERRKLEERHVCTEKSTARMPAIALPYN